MFSSNGVLKFAYRAVFVQALFFAVGSASKQYMGEDLYHVKRLVQYYYLLGMNNIVDIMVYEYSLAISRHLPEPFAGLPLLRVLFTREFVAPEEPKATSTHSQFWSLSSLPL